MKTGDIVRFRDICNVSPSDWYYQDPGGPKKENIPWAIGLLIEYHTWEKIASILYEDKIIRVSSGNVEKAGKKDLKQVDIA